MSVTDRVNISRYYALKDELTASYSHVRLSFPLFSERRTYVLPDVVTIFNAADCSSLLDCHTVVDVSPPEEELLRYQTR